MPDLMGKRGKKQYPERVTLLSYCLDLLKESESTTIQTLLEQVEAVEYDKIELTPETSLAGKVAIGKRIQTMDFLKAFMENKLNHVIQTSNDDLLYELFVGSVILKKPHLFLNHPLTILNAQNSADTNFQVWQENFSSTSHKGKVLDGIQSLIQGHKSLERLSDNILIVIDELFSNALFNAPVDENNKSLFKALERSQRVDYPGKKVAKIFGVHSTNDLFIGTVDPWGSVKRDDICRSLYQAYSQPHAIKDQTGTGLGLRMVLDRARSLYVLSERGKKSLICCHMRLNISLKKVENVPKQLHIHCF